MTVSNGDMLKTVMEVTLHEGTIAQNVFYFFAQLLVPQADAVVLSAIETWIETAYGELSADLMSSMTQNLCTVSEVDISGSPLAIHVVRLIGYFTPTIAFSNVTDELPNQTSAFATFNTFLAGHRGRKFLFPFGEDRQDGTYLIAASLANMADFADDCLDNINFAAGSDLLPVVLSIPENGALTFQNAVVTDVLGTQRRRRPGVGA